jgi:hypothetical protein
VRVLRFLSCWVLAGVTFFAAQTSAQDSTDATPGRGPAPKSSIKMLIERGTRPLSEQLPDTDKRRGRRPADVSPEAFGSESVPASVDRGPDWSAIEYSWAASELRHRPLYFEDAMLERHGQSRHPLVQPLASGTRFLLTFPVLPYAMTVNSPRPAHTTLGSFRPGSGAPRLLQRPPLQVDAGLMEAGVWVGLLFIMP